MGRPDSPKGGQGKLKSKFAKTYADPSKKA